MGCLRRLFRLLVFVAVIVVIVVILALLLPQFLARAGSTLLNNNNSAAPISGLAQLIPANILNKNNQLQISLSGLNANKKYDVTLDPGTCGSSGSVDVGLVTSDDSGNVTTTFSLSPLSNNNKSWFVDVHSGVGTNDPMIVCGQLNTNDSIIAASATNTVLQLSPVPGDLTSAQTTSGVTSTSTTPRGFPNTGVAPGGSNSYDNSVYPRKF
jgi:hypothetical protein